ncbi:FkbM family methyltransferase [Belnapia sp. T18]|uniref:FkbM family methyltransferase n=1 Tax=Belnapia arida TaxID=2804533 RepID=A0ABS1U576_9PROT|nr:FkbM family methyltransferase [Belnapia arida]MBL6079695.1 FkbM family methyltransferase [Belnapia arida]
MPIERTDAGIWVVVGDTLRTPWVKEKGKLAVDHLIPHICALIRPGDTVIDVGANIGDHTISYLDAVNKNGTVIAFEPDPECYACCVLNCGKFEDFYCAAATDRRRKVALKTVSNRGENHIELDGAGVDGFPIDDLKLARCDLIKIDVEGAELLVLKGSVETIVKNKPIIVCELVEGQLSRFNTSIAEVKHMLDLLGYSGCPLISGEDRDWVFRHTNPI